MSITLEELRNNLDHWVDVARTEDVTVTEGNKPVVRLTRSNDDVNRMLANLDSITGILSDDITEDEARVERLSRI